MSLQNNSQSNYHPEFEFGHGLSYSEYAISELKLSTDTLLKNEELKISFVVKNKGSMDGTKNIDLFVKDHYASLAPDVKNLKDFTKVFLKAGQEKEVVFEVDKNDLFFYNKNGKELLEEGDFTISVEDKSKSFYFKD